MTASDRTLSDLARDIGRLTELAAYAVSMGHHDIAARLVDQVRADVAELERRVKGGGRVEAG